MSQTENPETRAKSSAPKEKPEPLCHIHDQVFNLVVDYIREYVCVNDEELTEFEGKHYCLFHLPTKDKDIEKFKEKFNERLKAVEDKIAEIEKLPEEEQEKAKANISYDFRYVWFPSVVILAKKQFKVAANFSYATFTAEAYFSSQYLRLKLISKEQHLVLVIIVREHLSLRLISKRQI